MEVFKTTAKEIYSRLKEKSILMSDIPPFISDELIFNLEDEFMPEGLKNCRKDFCQTLNCQSRCGYHYWNEHGLITKSLMEELALWLGEDAELYGKVGYIHDIDYLSFPHDRGKKGDFHPVPLTTKLVEENIHPEIGLAILDHAPHLKINIENRSILSSSLTICEELATLLSIKDNSDYYSLLSEEAQSLAESLDFTPKNLIDISMDKKPRVAASPQKCINEPLSELLGKIEE
ncbi:hypothetical protein [Colwellia psychrerythraea]|uniref:Metal dependent phosphohydrolase n=1 Tax=Colwellia psychrerythraea TaxID=28229 RepID=A0A099KYQ2_COLPS|nr:hypothetical protein [Colwellia psychrerythraea]KGJ95874.1 hypothetical protein GAB14E_1786 [Colwellia psychrerythraea]